jgi:biotin carboxylase
MDKARIKAIRAEQVLARRHLAECELRLADAKRGLDKANQEHDKLQRVIARQIHGMRVYDLSDNILARKAQVDQSFTAWSDAQREREQAMAKCCAVAKELKQAKAQEELP